VPGSKWTSEPTQLPSTFGLSPALFLAISSLVLPYAIRHKLLLPRPSALSTSEPPPVFCLIPSHFSLSTGTQPLANTSILAIPPLISVNENCISVWPRGYTPYTERGACSLWYLAGRLNRRSRSQIVT